MTLALDSHHVTKSSPSGQLLTFQLGDNTYGVDILQVREIRAIGPIAVLPGAPAYVRGVMNLRGAVVPVIDLRKRLGLAEVEIDRFAVIIVVRIDGKNVGLMADAVNEVIPLSPEHLKPPPLIIQGRERHFIEGFALRPDAGGEADFVIVLSLQRIYDVNLNDSGDNVAIAPPLNAVEVRTAGGEPRSAL